MAGTGRSSTRMSLSSEPGTPMKRVSIDSNSGATATKKPQLQKKTSSAAGLTASRISVAVRTAGPFGRAVGATSTDAASTDATSTAPGAGAGSTRGYLLSADAVRPEGGERARSQGTSAADARQM